MKPVPEAIRDRRAVRDFEDRPLEPEVLEAILDDARRAPSGFNLQPTRFVVVRGAEREGLSAAAFDQRQIREAPVTVVVVADKRAHLTHLDTVLAHDLEAGAIDSTYADTVRRHVRLLFSRGPLGLGGFLKRGATYLLGRWKPVPNFPAADPVRWATVQAAIAASHLLLAASARDVASCPMEGFGEARVRRHLGIPRRFAVVLLVPLGYAEPRAAEDPRRTRFPLDHLVRWDRW